jgi:hypothetical protein
MYKATIFFSLGINFPIFIMNRSLHVQDDGIRYVVDSWLKMISGINSTLVLNFSSRMKHIEEGGHVMNLIGTIIIIIYY